MTDFAAEDWEFPDVTGMDPADVAKLWSDIELQAAEANRRAKRLAARKAVAKDTALRLIEESPYSSVRVPLDNGREVNITPYPWEIFNVVDEAAFKAWLAEHGGDDDFYDGTPRLREGDFQDAMRKRSQDRQPLPPGVTRWEDTRISRTLVPQRRRKAQ